VSYARKEDLIDDYVEALIKDISSQFSNLYFPLSTIYFGGGTPTLLKPKHFEKILKALESRKLKADSRAQEVSIEANPGTVSLEFLKKLHNIGINRLSLGAQSFNDKYLKYLGRIHNSKQIYQAFENAKEAGFENINLDLIFAIPGQTLEEWKEDLAEALSLKPEHLSTYNLQIEEGTPLWGNTKSEILNPKQIPISKSKIINEDLDANMYELTIETLTSVGFKHYEISNFAKPGFECQHNINYWKMGNWLGIGAGAHSHVNGKHWENTSNVEEYIGSGGVRRNGCRLAPDVSHDLPAGRQGATDQRETLFMGLRLLDGINKAHFIGFEKEIVELKQQGLLEESGDNIRLTKKGLFLGNLVFEKFV